MQVAFQGVEGAYSETAAKRFFPDQKNLKTVAMAKFPQVFAAVARGEVDAGMVPIENSFAGSIHENYDHLLHHQVSIFGETYLRVVHNLLGCPGTEISSIDEVYSHPQALAQCAGFTASMNGVQSLPYFDTAGAARFVAEKAAPNCAAIASADAAARYGLQVLSAGIEDSSRNHTRFLLIGPASTSQVVDSNLASDGYKTSIVFSLTNLPGCLHRCLSIFAIRDIDLFKIESRPDRTGDLWTYMFYLDFAGHRFDTKVERALSHLQEITSKVKVLGSYPVRQSLG